MAVPVTGTLTTTAPSDYFAVTDPLYGIDSWRSVADYTERNAITTLRRREGMAVWAQSDSTLWILNAAPWAGDDTDWTLFSGSVQTNLTFIPPGARVATTAALTATYANGTAGVGATLTNSGTQAALTIDSVALSAADVVLVKNQAAPAQNGIYAVTTVGSGATNWVLTRTTNYDATAEITQGSYVVIGAGTVNVGTLWIMTGATPITVGTTAITFTTLILTGTGTVSSVSVVSANGLAGTVANATTTPAITLSTTITGLLKGNGTAISAAIAGTDYLATNQAITLSSDVTGSGTTAIATTIGAKKVTYPKIQDVAASSLLGNPSVVPGQPAEITLGTGLAFSGTTLVATGGSGGGGSGSAFAWGLAMGAPAAVATDLALWETCQEDGTLEQWNLIAKTGPVGDDLVIDILISSDNGATFTSLWASNPGDRPTILDGDVAGTGTAFDTAAFANGDVLRIDIIQVGSGTAGSNIAMRLKAFGSGGGGGGGSGTVTSVTAGSGLTGGAITTSGTIALATTGLTINQHAGVITTDTDAGPVVFNFAVSDKHKVTIGASRTFSFTNPTVGQVVTIIVIQGTTGSFTVTWPGTVKWGDSGVPTLSTTTGDMDIFVFLWNGTNYLGATFGSGF